VSSDSDGKTVSTRKKIRSSDKKINVVAVSENEFNLETQISEIKGKDKAMTLGRKMSQLNGFNSLEPLFSCRLRREPDTGRRMIRQMIFTGKTERGDFIPME
jgi:hypothetical protein